MVSPPEPWFLPEFDCMRASSIASVTARQIFDSRGRPTVEARVALANGTQGSASVPSGSSTGRYEAHELRDGDPLRYGGLSVFNAVANVRGEIASVVIGRDAFDQSAVDRAMIERDGSPALKRLGANAVLAVSLAVARAAARQARMPLYVYLSSLCGDADACLPVPMANLINGASGRSGWQDFMAVPLGARTFSEAVACLLRLSTAAGERVREASGRLCYGDDGGVAFDAASAEAVLDLLVAAAERAGLVPGQDVAFALDVAASETFTGDGYRLRHDAPLLSAGDLSDLLAALAARYPIVAIEDPFDQDDWTSWSAFGGRLSGRHIVADDLFATNVDRTARGIAEKAATAAIVKPTQNGTLTGTIEAVDTLRRAGLAAILAGRSGDTEDAFIADLAVALGGGLLKTGALRGSERMGKYNRLLAIEDASALPFAAWRGAAG